MACVRAIGSACLLAAGLCLLGPAPASADVIVLKNGRRIQATAVREQGARITYETENGEYSLPRSLVASIEKQAWSAASKVPTAPPAGSGERPAREIPLPVPSRSTWETPVLQADGRVDRQLLEDLLRKAPADGAGRGRVVNKFLAAVDYEMEAGRADSAFSLAQAAVTALPAEPQLMLTYGILLLQRRQVQLAREWLLRARAAAPDSPQAWKFSGFADYLSDRTDEAIRAWQKALALAPDPGLQKMLEKAQREAAAEAAHQQAFSGHFNLRFEGRQVAPEFRRQLLDLLERLYGELDRTFDARMRDPIPVILYTDQAFRDVTRAPAWAGAVNDGRLRIPVEGLRGVTAELESVLRHELAHSFIRAKTGGGCPTWLNEGLAQYLDGSRARSDGRLAAAWAAGRRLPWPALERSFMGLEPQVAAFAYAQSLAAAEFLVSRFGLHEAVRLLQRLAEGQAPEAALSSVYRMSYADLDGGIARFLAAH